MSTNKCRNAADGADTGDLIKEWGICIDRNMGLISMVNTFKALDVTAGAANPTWNLTPQYVYTTAAIATAFIMAESL